MQITRRAVMALAVFAFVLSGAAYGATYVGTLSGPAESPPNASPGTGSTIVTYDPAAHTLTIHVVFSGLTAGNTASHIHCCTAVAGAGTAGVATVTPTFTGFPTGATSGTYDHVFDLTQAGSFNPAFVTANGGTPASAEAVLASGIAANKAYLNIHTTAFAGGEIRSFLALQAPATIAKSFAPATIEAGSGTTLNFTLTNPTANTVALTGVGVVDVLPAGLTVAPGATSACGGTVTLSAPGTITLSGASIAVGGSCQFGVPVTAAVSGEYVNVTANVTSANGGSGGTASARLSVLAPPIPALSDWGLVLLASLLLVAISGYLRRRDS